MPPKKADVPETNFIKIIEELRRNNPNIEDIELYTLFSQKLMNMSGGMIEDVYTRVDSDKFVITLYVFEIFSVYLYINKDLTKTDYITFNSWMYDGCESEQISEFNELYNIIDLELKKIYKKIKNCAASPIDDIAKKLKQFNISVDDQPAE